MAVIQQAPTFNQQSANIEQSRRLAKLLQEGAQQLAPGNQSVTVGPYTNVVPVSPLAAALKGLQTGYAAYLDADAAKQQGALEDRRLQATQDAFSDGNLDYGKLANSGVDAGTLAKLLVDKQSRQAEIEAKRVEHQAKLSEPTTGMREALWASSGDEDKARQLLQNKIQNPLGMLNYQLQAGNMAADNARQSQELDMQRQELALRQQQAEQSARRAEESAAQSRLQNVPAQHRMAYAENQNALNKIDSAIAQIQQNPSALGAKNYLGDAISQRIDQEGVPVRAAVAEIGGVKLHDLSGAAVSPTESKRLMPLIPQATDSPEAAVEKLKALRREYEGINSQLESMYDSEDYRNPIVSAMPRSQGNVSVDIKPETWQSMTPAQRRQAIAEVTKPQGSQQKPNVIRYDAQGNRVQ